MKRITFARLAVLMLALAGLALSGCCGGDDNGGLSAADMARIDTAEADAAAAHAEAEALEEKLEELEAELAAVGTDDEDTSDLDAAIEALQMQIAALTEKTADPKTAMEILGGNKSKFSANDIAAMGKKVVGQLNARYDHDMDEGMVNLPELENDGDDDTTEIDKMTRDVTHASQIMEGTKKYFLRHTFKDTGTMVDLASPGDIETLSLKSLMEVDGIELMSFEVEETDKIATQTNATAAALTGANVEVGTADLPVNTMRTVTLGKDGSMSVVDTNTITGKATRSVITSYIGGEKIVETLPLADGAAAAVLTRATGATLTYNAPADVDADTDYPATNPVAALPDAAARVLPATDLAQAEMMYNNSKAPDYTIAQHSAMGYGAWLEDSFFVAYVITTEDDAKMTTQARRPGRSPGAAGRMTPPWLPTSAVAARRPCGRA